MAVIPGVISSRSMPNQVAKEMDDIYRVTLAEWESEYDKVLKVQSAPAGPHYYQSEITGLDSLPAEIAEGDGVIYGVPVEGHEIMRRYKQFGLGYIITDLMLKDELYGKMKKLPADLAKAMRVLNDLEGLRIYNEAEIAIPAGGPGDLVHQVKDAKGLCANTGHTLLNDVMNFQQDGSSAGANTAAGRLYNIPYTAADLTETTFREAQEYFKQMVDENGFKNRLMPSRLVIPYGDSFVAHRLHTQQYGGSEADAGLGSIGVNSTDQATMLNLGNPKNGFVGGWSVIESRYMDDDRWFFLADVDEGPGFYWKEQPKQTSKVDFDTDNIRYKSKQRFNVWAYEYRGVWGNITGHARSAA